ncbi:MAG TPA: family 20 glycosylhydrolase [Microbacterium sp.]|nr:family 20 glycosylhydrolase [Microbacterium sp.]
MHIVPAPAVFQDVSHAAPYPLDAVDRDSAIEIALDALDEELVPAEALGAEGYRLYVDELAMRSEAATEAGLFYARQSLSQLVTERGGRWVVPAAAIRDAPRFAYRGVMLDVARHFFPVDVVKGVIDRAAALKLNALHLHLTDDQGWRIEIESWPKLTERASGSSANGDPGGFYTKADYREIVAYAASRHMIVVPEVDVPGHTHAVSIAYPELTEAPVLTDAHAALARDLGQELPVAGEPYTGWAVGFSSLRIHDEATYAFLADVFGELAEMTPGPYLHLGGDEALGTPPEDFDAFVARTSQIIAGTRKTPIAWHEAGAAPGLALGTIGQCWSLTVPADEHAEAARGFVAHGGKVIFSPADAAYLDHKYDESTPIGLAWANGPTSVERSYAWDPARIVPGIDEHDILGVEAPLWTETIASLADIDLMAFPRIASAAEIAWSPEDSALRTWDSFRARVGALGPLWASQGTGFHRSPEIDWAPGSGADTP